MSFYYHQQLFAQTTNDTRGLSAKKTALQNQNTKIPPPTIELEENQICNVYSISYSPDGNYIAAAYNNSNIRIWSVK